MSKIRTKIGRLGGFKKKKDSLVNAIMKTYNVSELIEHVNFVNQSTQSATESKQEQNIVYGSERGDDNEISNEESFFEVNISGDDNLHTEKKSRDFVFDKDQFQSQLAQWAINNQIKHEQLAELLLIWNNYVPLEALPADPRTILHTPNQFSYFSDVINFNGLHECLKCERVGKYSHTSGTVVFPNFKAYARTYESFRAKKDSQDHKCNTPPIDLPIDMVLDVPVGDEVHLLHLSLVKKFMYGWKTGSFGMRTKWSSANEKEISAYLVSCNIYRPSEIHRKISPLSEMPRWKAAEYRTFLYYTSLTVLKKFLPEQNYNHYLLFYCSIAIFGSEYHCEKMIDTADEMIKTFLNLFKSMYGIHHFSSNLQNLLHLSDEVRRCGVLDKFNACKFENKLQDVKKLVRLGNYPLQQIVKRILEGKSGVIPKNSDPKINLRNKTNFDCIDFQKFGSKYTVFSELKTNEFRLDDTTQNQWIFTKNFDIVRLKCFVLYENKRCYFYGNAIAEKKSFFETPFKSDHLFIYGANDRFKSTKLYEIKQISCKLFCLPYFGSYNDSEFDEDFPLFDFVFVPLWHTLN